MGHFFIFLFQMTASTQSRVLLENVQVRQSGTYLCEVTVTPGYYALMQFANMTVVGKWKIVVYKERLHVWDLKLKRLLSPTMSYNFFLLSLRICIRWFLNDYFSWFINSNFKISITPNWIPITYTFPPLKNGLSV